MTWMASGLDDVRYAGRQLAKAPGFALVAGLTMALGIGATTAIFSVVQAVVLRPLPYPEPDRLLAVGEDFEGRGRPSSVSIGNFDDWRKHATSFAALGALQSFSFNLADNERPERVYGGRVTRSWFDALGVQPQLGRVFTIEEDAPGNDRVAVLSHRLWARRYASDPTVVGRTIPLNAVPVTVVGVMPAAFDVTVDGEELWTPLAITPAQLATHDDHYLTVVGRLAPGVSQAQAGAELRTIHQQMRALFPGDLNINPGVAEPLHQQVVGDYRQRLFVLLGAVGLVLLIACGNVANLLLARGGVRARELALRAAIGASRGRIVRQLLTETAVLGLLGGALGVVLAWVAVPVLVRNSPEGVPRLEQATVNVAVLAFAILTALVSALVTGLVPALRAATRDVRGALNEGGRTATGGRERLRHLLVAAEVALAIVLLVGAGLLVRSALNLQRTDPGFDPDGVMTARLTLPAARYVEAERVALAFESVVSSLAAMPSVENAAATTSAPLTPGGNGNGLLPEGKLPDKNNFVNARLAIVTLDYFRTLRIAAVRGRLFAPDDRHGGPRVAVVNESAAQALFPGQDPIGKRFGCCDGEGPANPGWRTIVGVVKDMRSRGPAQGPRPEFFLPIAQAPEAVVDLDPAHDDGRRAQPHRRCGGLDHRGPRRCRPRRSDRSGLSGAIDDAAAAGVGSGGAVQHVADAAPRRLWPGARGDRRLRGDRVFRGRASAGDRDPDGGRGPRRRRPRDGDHAEHATGDRWCPCRDGRGVPRRAPARGLGAWRDHHRSAHLYRRRRGSDRGGTRRHGDPGAPRRPDRTDRRAPPVAAAGARRPNARIGAVDRGQATGARDPLHFTNEYGVPSARGAVMARSR